MPQWSTNLILINSEFSRAFLGLDVSPRAFTVPWLEWCGTRDTESSAVSAPVEPSFTLFLIFGSIDYCCTVLRSVCKDRRGDSLPHLRPAGPQQWAAWGVYVNPFTIVMPSWVFRRHSTETQPCQCWRQGCCDISQGQLSRQSASFSISGSYWTPRILPKEI